MAFEDPPAGGGGYDYVQSGQPADPLEGESWYDKDANEAYVYDGASWLELSVGDHGELSGVQPGQHFNAGNGLGFSNGALDVLAGDGLGFSNGNLDVQAGNALGFASGTLVVQEGNIDHANLSNIAANAHHTRYADSEAQSATYPSIPMPKGPNTQWKSTPVDDGTGYTYTASGSSEEGVWLSTSQSYSIDYSGHAMMRLTVSAANTADSDNYDIGLRLVDQSDNVFWSEYSDADWSTTEYFDVRSWTHSATYDVEYKIKYDHDNCTQQEMRLHFPKTLEGTQ